MNIKCKNLIDWLFPVLLILFILTVITFLSAVGITYAGRSEAPDHTLTYRKNRLTWRDAEGIDENGAAKLSIFDAEYQNVSSSDGSAVIAPGTEGFHLIRLKNDADSEIGFTAVLYSIESDSNLPVDVSLADGDYTDAEGYILPDGAEAGQIIRSVSGSVKKGEMVDFDIFWLWSYEIDDAQDMIDVDFGNRSANGSPDDIRVGFYLVVEDNQEFYAPQTGDSANLTLYAAVMCVVGALLFGLTIFRKREKTRE